jgi:hypothetical protein
MRPDVRGVDAAVPELDREGDFLDAFKRVSSRFGGDGRS